MGAPDFFVGLRGGVEKHYTRASLQSDTVEDLISQRSRRLNSRSWPSEGHVTAMEDSS